MSRRDKARIYRVVVFASRREFIVWVCLPSFVTRGFLPNLHFFCGAASRESNPRVTKRGKYIRKRKARQTQFRKIRILVTQNALVAVILLSRMFFTLYLNSDSGLF